MSQALYLVACAMLSVGVLVGISMMSKVKTAVVGNILSAVSVLVGIVVTLLYNEILAVKSIYAFMAAGILLGSLLAVRVKMIQMPQLVALLNGVGGLASALVGILTILGVGQVVSNYPAFTDVTATLAMIVGAITLIGSLVAAGKLHKILPQKPVIWKNHAVILNISLLISLAVVVYSAFLKPGSETYLPVILILFAGILFSKVFGYAFAIRVGGADMPITISLLNSLSGVAGAIAGMAIGDILLVSVGGIVGASGLFLTQIMCRSMNRSLVDILTGKTSVSQQSVSKIGNTEEVESETPEIWQGEMPDETLEGTPVNAHSERRSPDEILRSARSVIIVPGYGMALAQAQHLVRELADKLEANGADVKYAIHPVAGRMPGHMNVLLAEADVSYDKLFELDTVNDDFADTDAVIVVGANDVLNPAARDAVDTPIYGMPVLNVDCSGEIFICNFDLSPGYSGVDNPLYTRKEGVHLFLGDAKESVRKLIQMIG